MRLVIDGPGYASAAEAFTTANQVAAIQYDSLVGRLGSYAAMAGDDSTSSEFAAAYDEAATEAVSALADVVPAFANLGRLTHRCVSNHREANVGSIISGPVVYDGSWLPGTECVSVLAATPPSALGGDPPSLSDEMNWILDHIEGFVWPNADTDRLRSAACVWRAAAAGLDRLVVSCGDATDALWTQRSPEIPVAVAATEELASAVQEVGSQFAGLATACEEYADQVDQKREEILALLKEILAMIVEGIVVSVAIGLITGGAGALAASGAVVAKVAAQSPRFAAILSALRTAASATSTTVRTARTALRSARLRVRKFLDARIPPRNEFGHLTIAGGRRFQFPRGWLSKHEHSGSHTIDKHVGKTADELNDRFVDEPWLPRSSTFRNQDQAEDLISRVLMRDDEAIQAWLRSPSRDYVADGVFGKSTGFAVEKSGLVSDMQGVRVILKPDPTMTAGYRVHTAYPIP